MFSLQLIEQNVSACKARESRVGLICSGSRATQFCTSIVIVREVDELHLLLATDNEKDDSTIPFAGVLR